MTVDQKCVSLCFVFLFTAKELRCKVNEVGVYFVFKFLLGLSFSNLSLLVQVRVPDI